MPRKRNLDLSITERRLQALRNELEGSRRYVKGLRELLEEHPEDKWAEKQLEHYEQRIERLEAQIAEFG